MAVILIYSKTLLFIYSFNLGQLTDVSSLRCHSKIEYSCEGSVCDLLPSASVKHISECAPHENRCGSIDGEISGNFL